MKKIERNQIRIFIYRFQTPEKDNYIFIYFVIINAIIIIIHMCVSVCAGMLVEVNFQELFLAFHLVGVEPLVSAVLSSPG